MASLLLSIPNRFPLLWLFVLCSTRLPVAIRSVSPSAVEYLMGNFSNFQCPPSTLRSLDSAALFDCSERANNEQSRNVLFTVSYANELRLFIDSAAVN